MAWTPPKDAVAVDQQNSWTPPADAVAVQESAPAKTEAPRTGVQIGKDLWEKTGTKGVAEAAATAVTGTLSTVAGDALGMSLAAANKVRGALGLAPTRVLNPATGQYTDSGLEVSRGIKEAGTYQPRSESGKTINEAIGTVMTPITKTARFAGDVVEGATGSPLAGDVANDIANAVIGAKVIKIAPKVAKGTVDTTVKAAEVAGPYVKKGVDIATNSRMQSGAAVASLLAGNPVQAAGHAAVAVGRKIYDRARAAKVAEEAAPATVGDVIAEPVSGLSRIKTKEQALADRAAWRAEADARRAQMAAERNARSTMYDTAETQAAMAPAKSPQSSIRNAPQENTMGMVDEGDLVFETLSKPSKIKRQEVYDFTEKAKSKTTPGEYLWDEVASNKWKNFDTGEIMTTDQLWLTLRKKK